MRSAGANVSKFGMIGATDSHTGLATYEETNFWGKYGADSTPEGKDNIVIPPDSKGWDIGAAGLAGVWAEENSREAIFLAMRRKETFGTSGPRIVVRFFGGWEFTADDAKSRLPANAGYMKGVPMGGDLTAAPAGKAPTFLVGALKDPLSGNLDRIQVIKGWYDKRGYGFQQVYDVAWAGDRQPDQHGKLPPVGSTVDVADASYTNTIGDPLLTAFWKDPDFDPDQRAFYYVRVLEIPKPTWQAYDARRFGVTMSDEVPMIVQDRAYSSPIWYTP